MTTNANQRASHVEEKRTGSKIVTTFKIDGRPCMWMSGEERDGRFVIAAGTESDIAAQTVEEAIDIAATLIDAQSDAAERGIDE